MYSCACKIMVGWEGKSLGRGKIEAPGNEDWHDEISDWSWLVLLFQGCKGCQLYKNWTGHRCSVEGLEPQKNGARGVSRESGVGCTSPRPDLPRYIPHRYREMVNCACSGPVEQGTVSAGWFRTDLGGWWEEPPWLRIFQDDFIVFDVSVISPWMSQLRQVFRVSRCVGFKCVSGPSS